MPNAELRKAAVLLSSLRPRQATRLLAGLDPAPRNAVLGEMRRHDHPTKHEQSLVLVDLASAVRRSGDLTKAATAAQPDRSIPSIESRSGETHVSTTKTAFAIGRPYAFLQTAASHAVRKILRNEHPQLIALVLTSLEAAQAAEILAQWPGELVASILRRMANMSAVSPEVTAEVGRWIKRRMASLEGGAPASTR